MVRETTDDTVDWAILGDLVALTAAAVLFHLAFVMKVALNVASRPEVAVAILGTFLLGFALLTEAVSNLVIFDRGREYAVVLAVVLLISIVIIGGRGGLYTLGSYGVLSIAAIVMLSGAWRDQ
jgi:hypothetical protein